MFKSNVPRQLLILLVASVGATVLAGMISYVAVTAVGSSAERLVTNGLDGAQASYDVLDGFSNKRAGIQRLLRLTDADEIETSLKEIEALDKRLDALLAGSDGTLEAIRTAKGKLAVTEKDIIERALRGDYAGANTQFITVAGGEYEAAEAAVRKHTEAASVAAKEALARAAADGRRNTLLQLAALGMVLVVLAAFGWMLRRRISAQLNDLTGSLSETGSKLALAAQHVAATSGSLSENAASQAASLEQTSASMEEMASMTKANAENAHDAARIMGEVDVIASASNAALQGLIVSMTSIQDSSAKVSRIIKTIDEIAFQTNILALNAAVEAARAGEAGMGFAVVADEVRTLAQRSAVAARDTAALIEEATTNAAQGGSKMQEVVDRVASITSGLAKAKELVDQVSAASTQQAQGVTQVTQAVTQMEHTTQANAATAEETAASSQELNYQAQATRTLVERLQTMMGRNMAEGAVVETGVQETEPLPSITPVRKPTLSFEQFARRKSA